MQDAAMGSAFLAYMYVFITTCMCLLHVFVVYTYICYT